MARRAIDNFHQHLPANTQGRDFFVGDIHGRLDALLLCIGDVSFDPKNDRIICVGDLIDRGTNSYELLRLTNEPWFFAVRGNHETMFLDTSDPAALAQWFSNGGDWFNEVSGEVIVDSYALAANLPTAITINMPNDTTIGVCHAEWPENDWATVEESLSDPQTVSSMLWGRTIVRNQVTKWDKTATLTVHGHTPIEEVQKFGSAIFIDTGCVHGGKLTMLETEEAINWPSSS